MYKLLNNLRGVGLILCFFCLVLFIGCGGGKWGYIDKLNNMVITPQYEEALQFKEGLAPVKFEGKWIYIDKTGKKAISAQFEYAGIFNEGLATVKLDEKWGFIDKTGNIVIRPRFDDEWYFSEGLAGVKVDDKWVLLIRQVRWLSNLGMILCYHFLKDWQV